MSINISFFGVELISLFLLLPHHSFRRPYPACIQPPVWKEALWVLKRYMIINSLQHLGYCNVINNANCFRKRLFFSILGQFLFLLSIYPSSLSLCRPSPGLFAQWRLFQDSGWRTRRSTFQIPSGHVTRRPSPETKRYSSSSLCYWLR